MSKLGSAVLRKYSGHGDSKRGMEACIYNWEGCEWH